MSATATIARPMDSIERDCFASPAKALTRARLEAALTSYMSALTWMRRLPAAEVERRLASKVSELETAMREDRRVDTREDIRRSAAEIRRAITRLEGGRT